MKRFGKMLILVLLFAIIMSTIVAPASAASYPIMYLLYDISNPTIPKGETGVQEFMIEVAYANEAYFVELYDSKGEYVASAIDTYYNETNEPMYISISIDTAALDMAVGTYTVYFGTGYYLNGTWYDAPNYYEYTIQVINNVCNGNHNMQFAEVDTPATCVENGINKMKCTKCGHITYESVPGDHSYGEWKWFNTTHHGRTCTHCYTTFTEVHQWDGGVVTKEPTCAETGIKTYTCATCEGTKTETIPATGNHTYGAWTHTNDSIHTHTCTVCGNQETALHNWDAGTVTKEPTCSETGIQMFTCLDCGGTMEKTLPTNNSHSYGQGQKIDGETHYHTCTACGEKNVVPHTWMGGAYLQRPTSDTEGSRNFVCSGCGDTKTDVVYRLTDGDLNKDTKVDTEDVVTLLLYLSMPDMFPIDQVNVDFNDDGFSGTDDAVQMLLYMSMPDMFPLYLEQQ